MRYFRIFILYFEHVLQHRARTFVWFLVSLLNPLIFILFWRGAFQASSGAIVGWTMSTITSYYFLLTAVSSSLMSHIEEDVWRYDIQEGELVQYLLKPFSYFWLKFFSEIHYRILQGFYVVIVLIIINTVFGRIIVITQDKNLLLYAIIIAVLAYLVSFIFKMIVGFIAFWTTDLYGIYDLLDIVMVVFAGYIVPINMLFEPVRTTAYLLPFSYMIYFPVLALQGKLSPTEISRVIGYQVIWLIVFIGLYLLLWKKGIKKFTGVGQ